MKLKKAKRGFTLVELLGVVLIIAIIVLIAVPIILNIVKVSKKAANKSSVNALIRSIELNYIDYDFTDDLLFTFGDYSEDSVNSSNGNQSNIKINDINYVKFDVTNNPSTNIEGLINTDSKSISDLIDYKYYDETLYDSEKEYEKIQVEEIEQNIQSMIDDQLSKIDYYDEDNETEYVVETEDKIIYSNVSNNIKKIIQDELLVSGKTPDYGYVLFSAHDGIDIQLKLIYDEFCYIKDSKDNNIRVTENLDDCGFVDFTEEYSNNPDVNFIIDNGDIVSDSNDWYTQKLKVIMYATSPQGDDVDYINYCKTSEDICNPNTDGKKIDGKRFTFNLEETGPTKFCASAVTKSGVVGDVQCSETYKIDIINPKNGKMLISGEKKLSNTDWYTSEVIVSKLEDGSDDESGLYLTQPTMENIGVSSFGTIVSLVSTDVAGNNSFVNGKVKVDLDEPVIYGIDEPIVIKKGTNADFDKGIKVIDAISGGLGYTLSFNSTENLDTGDYEVTYTAYDKAGNSASYIRNVEVLDEREYEDYLDLIDPNDVCIGNDCVCNGGDCVCLNDDCDQLESSKNKDLAITDDYVFTLTPSGEKSLIKRDYWSKTAFYLYARVQNVKGIKIKAIYWCTSISDTLDAEDCNPLEHYDGSRKSPYRNGAEKLSRQIRVNMSNNQKIMSAQASGSTKICAYAVGMDDTRSNVYCSDLYKIDIEKPKAPEFTVEGLKVTNMVGKKEREYYKPGAILKIKSLGTDNLTDSASLNYQLSPTKKMTLEQLMNDGYPISSSMIARVTAKDLAGNSSKVSSLNVSIDRTGPSMVYRKAYTLYSNIQKWSGWRTNEPLRIVLSVSSGGNTGAKVDHFEMSRDKVNWTEVTSEVIVYNPGRYYFKAVDEFGQSSSYITSFYANIILTSDVEQDESINEPIISLSPEEYSTSKQVSISYDDTYEKFLKVTGSKKSTANVDLIKCEYEKTSKTQTNLNLVCDDSQNVSAGSLLEEGQWYKTMVNPVINVYENYTNITARVRNANKKERSVAKQINSIDTIPSVPIITGGSKNWQKEAKISILGASKAPSGIKNYEYCINSTNDSSNCNWIQMNGTELIYKEPGEHYIFYRAVSNTNLISDASLAQYVKIDGTAPIVSTSSGSVANISISDDISGIKQYCVAKNNSSDSCVYATAEENISGKVLINKWYSLSNVNTKQFNFTSDEGGTYYVFAKDAAGNMSDAKTFKIGVSGINAKAYVPGETVEYAGLSWTVINDNGENVSLILDGYYKSGSFGEDSTWNNSTAKQIVNEDFVNNYPELKTELESGSLVYDSDADAYVRLPRYDEISSNIVMNKDYPFWTMTSNGNVVYASLSTGTVYRDVYNATTTMAKSSGYTYSDSSNYDKGQDGQQITDRYITECNGTYKEQITLSPGVTNMVTSSSCGNKQNSYASSVVTYGSKTSSKPNWYYCDSSSGKTKVSESAQTSTYWTYANTSSTNCSLISSYRPSSNVKSLVYRPVIVVKKVLNSNNVPILEDKNYSKGDKVDYASLKWQVVTDNDNTVTLILNGNYKTGNYGTSNVWSSSIAKTVVNEDFVNNNKLIKNAIDNGYIIYDSFSSSYVRLPLKDEIDVSLTSASKLPFWTMTTNNSQIYYSLYNGEFTRNNYNYSLSSYYEDYYMRDPEWETLNDGKAAITVNLMTSCSNTNVETLFTPSMSEDINTTYTISNTCGSVKYNRYASSNWQTTSQSSNSSVTFSYCDSYYGGTYYSDTAYGYQLYWPHATSGSNACALRGVYEPIRIASYIGYRPVITVKKGS